MGVPYELKKVDGGWKVAKKNGRKTFSKKPMTKKKAEDQMAALYANESTVDHFRRTRELIREARRQ